MQLNPIEFLKVIIDIRTRYCYKLKMIKSIIQFLYQQQKMFLTLTIKCLNPQSPSKDYLFKINNQQLKIDLLIQNTFIHKYQYYYTLWPCQADREINAIIELHQKKGEEIKFKGKVTAKIKCTQQGDVYKMHGIKEQDELILMKFKVQKEREDTKFAQQTELKKINKQMQQNLLKYRKQIEGYQQFLHFTNDVIKELNPAPINPNLQYQQPLIGQSRIKRCKQQNNHQQIEPSLQSSKHHKKSQISSKVQLQTPRSLMKISVREVSIPKSQGSSRKIDQQIEQDQNKQEQSQVKSQANSIKANEERDHLNKYSYLQDYSKKKEDKSIQQVTNEQIDIVNIEVRKKKEQDQIRQARSNYVSKQIKKRRLKYLIPKQSKHIQAKPLPRNNSPFSIKQNISQIQINVNKQHNTSNAEQPLIQGTSSSNAQKPQEPQGKTNVSQTGLKQIFEQQKHISVNKSDYMNQIQNISLLQSRKDDPSSISNNIQKGITSRNKSDSIQKSEKSKIRQSKKQKTQSQITHRKKKVVQKESLMSSQYNIQSINQNNSIKSSSSKIQQKFINKLTIFNIHTLFYTNFKNSLKKCIIEHNHQIYQTENQQNNLKQTSWKNDRIVISSISPFQEIIFQIYSSKNEQLALEGSAIINIKEIIVHKGRYYKYYLYFEDIVVGYIDFNIEKEIKEHQRLSISLPHIKLKSKSFQEMEYNISKTLRVKTKNNEFSNQMSPLFISNQSIHLSKEHPSHLSLDYNELTSKIRNLKLQRQNKLK